MQTKFSQMMLVVTAWLKQGTTKDTGSVVENVHFEISVTKLQTKKQMLYDSKFYPFSGAPPW